MPSLQKRNYKKLPKSPTLPPVLREAVSRQPSGLPYSEPSAVPREAGCHPELCSVSG